MRSTGSANPLKKLGFAAAVCLGLCLMGVTTAIAAPQGVIGFFGNPSAAPSPNGAEFSTSPSGVAVNDTSGDVYVVDSGNSRIEQFDADGNFIRAFGKDVAGDGNELQSLVVQATGGTYKLTFQGQETGAINCTAPNPEVKSALEALVSIGAGNVEVSGGPGNNTGVNPYYITFTGALGHANQPQLSTSSSCTGGTSTATPATLANGFAGPAPDNANEMQAVAVNATAGQFRLGIGAGGPGVAETGDLPFNATPAEVQNALNALSNISAGSGSVRVSGGPGGGGAATPYLVDFDGGSLAGSDVPPLVGSSGTTPLSGGSGTGADLATVSTFAPGGGAGTAYEICETAGKCKAGAVTVTGSGNTTISAPGGGLSRPEGIAINQATGNLYVSNRFQQRVEEFDSNGNFIRAWGRGVIASGPGDSPLANAVQKLTIKATGGRYTLEFQGQKTAALPFDSSGATVQAALTGLSSIGAGNVEVTGGPGDETGTNPYLITFKGAFANTPVAMIVAASDGGEPLTGGAATTSVEGVTRGSNDFEICTAAAVCQKGVAGGTAGAFANTIGYPAVAPVGAPNAGNVLIPEPGSKRVEEFSSDGAFVRAFGWDVVGAGPGNVGTAFEICRAAVFDVCKGGIVGTPATALGSFNTNTPTRVAVDGTGAIYTIESGLNFRVQKFSPTGESLTPGLFCPEIGASETLCGTGSADTPTDVAVDPSNDHVYVVKAFPAERRIFELDPAGTLVDTHISGYNVTSVNGIAVKAGGEPIYLTSSTPKAGVFVIGEPVPPHPTVEATTAVTASSAILHGRVNPNGGGPLSTTYRFEYRAAGEIPWDQAPATPVDIGNGEVEVPVSEPISGLQPNKAYEVRLVAIKGGSPVITTESTGNFNTDPAAPRAEPYVPFYDTSSEELILRGGVNPNNTPTSYFFEYGTGPCEADACTTTASGSAGAGGATVAVTERIIGLEPATTYHFRVVAENGVGGAVESAEATITTPAKEACTNPQFRIGSSAKLVECRAYERVSNGDSWGSGVRPSIGAIGDGGDRAQFFAQAFGQPQSAPAASSPYIAERTQSGWTVYPVLPEASLASGSYGGTEYMPSADLGTVLWPESSVGERLRGEVAWSLVRIDGSREPASEKLVPMRLGEVSIEQNYVLAGAAADLSAFVFRFGSASLGFGVTLFPDETLARKSSNLYETAGASSTGPGVTRIVNRGGPVSAENPLGVIGGVCGAGLGGTLSGLGTSYRAVSTDGSTIYFSAEPAAPSVGECSGGTDKRLYKRLGGSTTTEVSAPQCTPTPTCPGSPTGDDDYRGASTDGEVVIFTTPRRLTNSDGDSSSDLYLYDATPPPGEPTLVQASAGETIGSHTAGSGAEVEGVLDNAADGSRTYFVAKGVLSGSNAQGGLPSAGFPNLYVYERDAAHPTGRIAFVATLSGADAINWVATSGRSASYALPADASGGDGNMLLLSSAAQLLDEDTDSARDIYRYDDQIGALTCLTCMGEGNFDVKLAARSTSSTPAAAAQLARPASADLGSVVFTTMESLVAGDLNSANDVYLLRDGALSLVSVGTGDSGSEPAGAGEREVSISLDGKNVFFVTQAALVTDDVNNGLDLYNARVDGGFETAGVVAKCESDESCHGSLQQSPVANSPASATTVSPGNLPPPKACKKGQVRKKGKCVKKPVKHKKGRKHQKAGKKRAGTNQGDKR